jgi:tRNA G18 (ribose-2'-O)-methylase SpoU
MEEEKLVEYCKRNNHKIVVIEDTPNAIDINEVNYPANPIFVTGHENEGVSDLLIRNARIVVKIPQADTYCRCLNTSVACSIVMQDWFRKNKLKRIQTKNVNSRLGAH